MPFVRMKTNPCSDPSTEKRLAFDAATAMLAKGDTDSLRYAALELRRCIEAIVYEKLKVYGELLPEGSAHKWQPPQAFNALIAVEPDAEETSTFSVSVARQKEFGKIAQGPFFTMGVDERPKGKWVKETWNKLGGYLHAEWPFSRARKPGTSLQAFLEKTLAEIAPMVNNLFTVVRSANISFRCVGCEETVKVMAKAVERTRTAICLTCEMPYRAEKLDGNFTFHPDTPVLTCECGASTYVSLKQARIGYEFSCRSCSRIFRIVDVEWKYGPVDDDSASPQPEEG